MRARRMMLLSVTAAYLALLVFAVFIPNSASERGQWFWPLIAFVPVGVLLLLLLGRRRWWLALGFSVLAALWMEAAQSAWMPAGYANLGDLAWSAGGALAGVGIAAALTTPRSRFMRAHHSHRVVSHAVGRGIAQD